MSSDDLVKYGLSRVLGWVTTHPFETAGIVYIIKTPSLHPFGKATAANFARAAGSLAWNQVKITNKHLIKPAMRNVAKRIASQYAAQRAASIASPTSFGVGVGGAALSLAMMGVVIAAGEGQSGIQIAEGQQEYEIQAIRTGGGRGVVI